MSEPFIGEIRITGFNFAPQGWALCNGQQLSIAENDALFQLIGTTYGGDGVNTFNLPDLQSRIPIHMGTGAGLSPRVLAERSGEEIVTLTLNQAPSHNHPLQASQNLASEIAPAANVLAEARDGDLYSPNAPNVALNASSVSNVGGSQPHDNMQPFLCVNFIIALFGVFPSQN